MPKYKISYFDFPGGRGEECRLTLHVAGVDFEDDRFTGAQWRDRKSATPFGAAPILTLEDGRQLAQSNAILAFLGRELGLHPAEPWEAARHESLMMAVEDLREKLAQATDSSSDEAKRASREEFAAGWMKRWANNMEAQITGPFVAGDELHVADIKIANIMRWFKNGGVDYISSDYFEDHPRLLALYEALHARDDVRAWYARF